MFKRIFSLFWLGVGGLFVLAALQPSHYTISREVLIKASPDTLFPYINNSQKLQDWMPWKQNDPDVKMEVSGPAEGVGSKTVWNSTGQMGIGESEIVESISNVAVKSRLQYEKPMAMTQYADMTLTPEGELTKVQWAVKGENSLLGRLFGLFVNVDQKVGGEFEKGLNKLKAIVESPGG